MFKKITAFILSVTLFCAGTSAFTVSAEEQKNSVSDDLKLITAVGEGFNTKYYYANGEEIDVNSLERVSIKSESLPEKYDLRDYGRVTPVRNQGREGFCWNFASVASIESNILSQDKLRKELGENPEENIDLSEAGNAWYIFTPVADKDSVLYKDCMYDEEKGADGSNPEIISYGLSSGYGVYPESLMPYDTWGNGYSESNRFYSDYRLKEFIDYNNESVSSIKSAIINDGAVATMYSNYTCNFYTANDGMQAYYDDGKAVDGRTDYLGHVVAIVGWDDNFSINRFNPDAKPNRKGAWLCKNSWGTDHCSTAEGYEGYFWMSYETSNLSFYQFIMQDADSFDKIYQNQVSVNGCYKSNSASEVFEATGNDTLEQICYQTLGASDVSIDIYKLNKNYINPTDGILLTSVVSRASYSGVHTVQCPDGVDFNKGDKFSVVINCNKTYISMGGNNKDTKSHKNLSYWKVDSEWFDCVDDVRFDSPAIKAYTSNTDGVDKSELSKRVVEAKEYLGGDLSKEYEQRLKEQIKLSENVIEDNSLNQNKVNNQICLLNAVIEDIESSVYEINSMADYIELKNNNVNYSKIKKIVLNTDLDLSDLPDEETYRPIFSSNDGLTGVFEGNNHTVINGKFKLYDSGQFCSAFIYKINGGTVRNLNFKNFEITGDLNKSILASDVTDAVVENCTFTNCKVESYDNSATIVFSDTSGNIVYKNVMINNCSVYGATIGIYNTPFGNSKSLFENCSQSGVTMEGLGAFINIKTPNNKTIHCISQINNYSPSITITDDKCVLNEFYGEIKNVTVESGNVEKTDKGYIIDFGDKSDNIVNVEYNGKPNPDYQYSVDYKTRSIVLEKYIGSDSNIIIPDTIDKLPVGILKSEFLSSARTEIKFVNTGNSVNTIDDNCFENCSTLKKVELGNKVEKIGFYAFANCPALKEVTFNEGLKNIKNNAFEKCTSLCNVKLPDSLEELELYAFVDSGIMSVEFGRNIVSIESDAVGYAYQPCINNKKVRLPGFIINGYSNTAAEKFAKENGIKFVKLDTSDPIIADKPFDHSVFKKGDVNKDGVVDIYDATLIQKYLAYTVKLDDVQLSNAIIYDCNGKVNIRSVTTIQKYLVGLIDNLEVIDD